VTLIYADTSALIRAYFADEPDHDVLRALLLEGTSPVVSSEIARLELASAVGAAARAGRLAKWRAVLTRIDADCRREGPITLLRLRPDVVLPTARRLVLDQRLRTLDALHLAVALEECPALAAPNDIVLVTRDDDQATVAAAVGLAVA
jgi:predicted nucleic acid-binding protein